MSQNTQDIDIKISPTHNGEVVFQNTVFNVMLFMEYKRHLFTWKYICECAGRGQEGRMHHT